MAGRDVVLSSEAFKLQVVRESESGGYILAPSHEIQGDVPAEDIYALVGIAMEMAEGK